MIIENSIKKDDGAYMFALFLILIAWISFELFKFGFNLGKQDADAEKNVTISAPAK
ncbi:hypothetical protein [Pedobacter ghigonis]|uniref:hypothetical protein n=1 Tax=Pedobacter ghigonis TaxID=2730403 RepID=UPI00158C147D|nr:hypothetical protein [Pedobacter ghigonis]